MTEPRTRTAAEVADHAAIVQEEAQQLGWLHGGSAEAGRKTTWRETSRTFALVERLAAQVEDLAAVVAGEHEGDSLPEDPEPPKVVTTAVFGPDGLGTIDVEVPPILVHSGVHPLAWAESPEDFDGAALHRAQVALDSLRDDPGAQYLAALVRRYRLGSV